MKVPVVLVVPVSLSYSFLDDGGPDHMDEEETDTEEDTMTATESGESAVANGDGVGANGDGLRKESDGHERADDEPPKLDNERLEALGPEGIAQLDDDELETLDSVSVEELDDELESALRERLPNRDALFIGLGDAVIPTVLVASAAFFVDAGPEISFGFASASLPAVTAMAGILIGLVILLWMVLKGRAHAGLPLLNGGAIAGYLVGALWSGLTLAQALGIDGFL